MSKCLTPKAPSGRANAPLPEPLLGRLGRSNARDVSNGNRWSAPRAKDIKEAIRCQLERLLNTRCPTPSTYDDRESRSLLDQYGLPDLADASWSARRIDEELPCLIERVILRFEPRLTNVRVEIRAETSDSTARTLLISANLTGWPGPIPVAFHSRIAGELRPVRLSDRSR